MPGYRGSFSPRHKGGVPKDRAVRRANLRRISGLFRAYWPKVIVVTVLILLASALGVIPAFVIQAVFNNRIPEGDMTLTSVLVGVIVAIAIANGAMGVVQ